MTTSRFDRLAARPDTLDLNEWHQDVLVSARGRPLWRVLVHRLGWEEDDLCQEVLTRLAVKQRSPGSAYDPHKACVGQYLKMATQSILSHLRAITEADGRGGQGGAKGRNTSLEVVQDWTAAESLDDGDTLAAIARVLDDMRSGDEPIALAILEGVPDATVSEAWDLSVDALNTIKEDIRLSLINQMERPIRPATPKASARIVGTGTDRRIEAVMVDEPPPLDFDALFFKHK